ncbi:unnamed protein product [Rotaria socialis]|uniref:EamA domain-containing protein n=1 Tax=Rotaria socialis TaxID=392032 RepID=A0A817ZN56_9BILA|nr:unnamed protein product [Rotaria socialis]CAF4651612.1 unnamed protein product [Rotaria socialis]
MDEKSSTKEFDTTKNLREVEMKDDKSKEATIEKLIEPTVTINIDKPVESSPTLIARFAGIVYILLSAIIFTGSLFISKQLKVDVLDAIIPCYALHSAILIIYSKFIKHYSFYEHSKRHELFYLFINVFFSTTGVFSFYFAYRYLPLPDLITVRYTQVIWTTIITALLYREKPSIPMVIAILLTSAGVVFVAQPSFLFNSTLSKSKTHVERLIGLFIALYSSVALSIMIISNKHLLLKYKTKHSSIMVHYAVVTLIVLVAKVVYSFNIFTDGMESFRNYFFTWNYLFASLVCLLHIVAIVLTQKAVKREHPAIFTIVQSSNILFSLILQNIFSSTKSNLLSIAGSILVLASIVIITGLKYFKEKKQVKQ